MARGSRPTERAGQRSPGRPQGPAHREGTGAPSHEAPRERFLKVDPYRAHREWARYEGTPQRDLFRELRERFLQRHQAAGWALEVGPGPGRFTPRVGAPRSRRVLLDLSRVMLREAWEHCQGTPAADSALVQGDGFRAPLRAGSFSEVVALGNVVGFAPEPFPAALRRLGEALANGGELLLEIAPGRGERSRYLSRLPATAVGRLFRSPVRLVRSRVEREGFAPLESAPAREHGFHRCSVEDLRRAFPEPSWGIGEALAVAPALGSEPARIAEARRDPLSWSHLLELEEALGASPERWPAAAAMLVAVRRTAPLST